MIDSDSSLWAFYITTGQRGFYWKKDSTGSALMDRLCLIHEDEKFFDFPEENEDMHFFFFFSLFSFFFHVRNSFVSWQDFIQADRNKTRSLTAWHRWYNWGGDYTTYHSGRVKPLYRKMSELSSDDRFRILKIKAVTLSLCDNLRGWKVKTSRRRRRRRRSGALARQLNFGNVERERFFLFAPAALKSCQLSGSRADGGTCGPINTSSVALFCC